MAVVSMKALLETGVHFGHRTRKWNPKMKSYIFTERNGIHIIDLQQTLEMLEESYELVRETVANGGTVLFVGTKRQAQEAIQVEAERCSMPYVNARWLGGTLTNWRTIRSRIDELKLLEKRRDEGEFELLTKKEGLMLNRKIDKLQERLGGIRDMRGVPQVLFVVDVKREETAVHEANLLGIPVVALVDTNCDPGQVDYVIPSNDDAIRAIKLLSMTLADAVLEGMALRKDIEADQAEREAEDRQLEADFEDMADDELLGEATLAKLESGDYGDDEAADTDAGESDGESTDEPGAGADEEAEDVEGAAEAEDGDAADESGEDAEAGEGSDDGDGGADGDADAENEDEDEDEHEDADEDPAGAEDEAE